MTVCKSLTLHAPAKLNLFFEVLGKRPDGYHDILTVTTPISLFDTLFLQSLDDSQSTRFECCQEDGTDLGGVIPTDDRNLVIKAMKRLSEKTGVSKPVALRLIKRIPSEAGLGGGSSDAAAALSGLNHLWNLQLDKRALQKIGAEIGSDVPLFFETGLALGRGRGEILEALPNAGIMNFVLFKPPFGLSTAKVYAACSGLKMDSKKTPEALITAWNQKNFSSASSLLFNRLEEAAFAICPELATIMARIQKMGNVTVRMTGSGTALYAPLPDADSAQRLAEMLRRSMKGEVFVAQSPC